VRPQVFETTALGAAYLAGLGVGYWTGTAEIDAQWQAERVFDPRMGRDQADALIAEWRKAVDRAKGWAAR
jgi:glycerol kinase